MPAHRKISDVQLEILVSYMEEHKALARGTSIDTLQPKAAMKAMKKLWEELTAMLNAVMGAKKDVHQWRDYWRDIKYRIKKKVGEIEVYKRESGGRPPPNVVLTQWEERIFVIIGRRAVLGDETVRIPYDEDIPALPSSSSVVTAEYSPAASRSPPQPAPRPPSPAQPSTSRAPPVEDTPSAANSSAISKRKHRAGATAEKRTPSEGDSPAASKRSRRADANRPASPSEVPAPRWAWEAEQRRLALDQSRLKVEEGMLAEIRQIRLLMEQSVTTLRELNENVATTIDHLYEHKIAEK